MSGSVQAGSSRPGERGFGLVLTRREGEEIVIGDPRDPFGIIRIAGIRGDKVRIACRFPEEIEIHRREVADEIAAQDDDDDGVDDGEFGDDDECDDESDE